MEGAGDATGEARTLADERRRLARVARERYQNDPEFRELQKRRNRESAQRRSDQRKALRDAARDEARLMCERVAAIVERRKETVAHWLAEQLLKAADKIGKDKLMRKPKPRRRPNDGDLERGDGVAAPVAAPAPKPAPRPRGRPPKPPQPGDDQPLRRVRAGRPPLDEQGPVAPKRPRGRPRKAIAA